MSIHSRSLRLLIRSQPGSSSASSRPDLFLDLVISVRWRPRLLADLLLHPPTCALGCLIIGQWRPGSNAFERELTIRSDEQGRAAAFEDAVSVLAWWLDKDLSTAAEAAALLAWLHQSAGNGFIDDLTEREHLRLAVRNAFVQLRTEIALTMVDGLLGKPKTSRPLGAEFAAALELVVISDLSHLTEPAPLVNAYLGAIADDDLFLSVQRVSALRRRRHCSRWLSVTQSSCGNFFIRSICRRASSVATSRTPIPTSLSTGSLDPFVPISVFCVVP